MEPKKSRLILIEKVSRDIEDWGDVKDFDAAVAMLSSAYPDYDMVICNAGHGTAGIILKRGNITLRFSVPVEGEKAV